MSLQVPLEVQSPRFRADLGLVHDVREDCQVVEGFVPHSPCPAAALMCFVRQLRHWMFGQIVYRASNRGTLGSHRLQVVVLCPCSFPLQGGTQYAQLGEY